jgi:hypothetical protein
MGETRKASTLLTGERILNGSFHLEHFDADENIALK